MTARPAVALGRNAVLVIGLVIGVLVMHGLGDPSVDHSGMAMGQPQMPRQTSSTAAGMADGVGHGHDGPVAPAGEMSMAAICAFAVLLIVERVTRRSPQPMQRWAHPTVLRSRLLVGPEPPVPKFL